MGQIVTRGESSVTECLCEIESIGLVDLDRAQQECGIDGHDVVQREEGTDCVGDLYSRFFVERCEHADRLGKDEISDQL